MNEARTYWEQWQLENYGNALPGQQPAEIESGERVMQEQLVWFEREEQVWLDQQSF
jgi:hypothetical protein